MTNPSIPQSPSGLEELPVTGTEADILLILGLAIIVLGTVAVALSKETQS